jgi:hypothetical protein
MSGLPRYIVDDDEVRTDHYQPSLISQISLDGNIIDLRDLIGIKKFAVRISVSQEVPDRCIIDTTDDLYQSIVDLDQFSLNFDIHVYFYRISDKSVYQRLKDSLEKYKMFEDSSVYQLTEVEAVQKVIEIIYQ